MGGYAAFAKRPRLLMTSTTRRGQTTKGATNERTKHHQVDRFRPARPAPLRGADLLVKPRSSARSEHPLRDLRRAAKAEPGALGRSAPTRPPRVSLRLALQCSRAIWVGRWMPGIQQMRYFWCSLVTTCSCELRRIPTREVRQDEGHSYVP